MKTSLKLIISIITLINLYGCGGDTIDIPPVLGVAVDGATTINQQTLSTTLDSIPASALSAGEEESLAFMREEEKLARDVYTALYVIYGNKIFTNIAASEQSHTDAVLSLIERYDLPDPTQIDSYGTFANAELQLIYDNLVVSGSISELEALYVGATVEELDIYDIETQLDNFIDNQDITLVYQNLLKGSRNHLRSFDKQIKSKGGVYTPIYISQALYDSIINSPIEKN